MKFPAIIVAVTVGASLGGCAGQITGDDSTGGGGSNSMEEQIAIQKWTNDAYPIMANVCTSCHGGGNANAPAFLKANTPADMRTLLIGFTSPQVVNIAAPDSSRVLLKGAHEGARALTPDELLKVDGWIGAERDAANAAAGVTTISTDKVDLLMCNGVQGSVTPGTAQCPFNVIALDKNGLPGASIKFIAQAEGSGLYLSDLFLDAAADGVYLDHPLFVSIPPTGDPVPDGFDTFSTVKLNLVASTTSTPVCPGPSCDHIGAGAVAFINFPSTNKIQISFKVLEKYHPDDSGPPPPIGCGTNGFQSFITNMKPQLTGLCMSCHGGSNSGATSAMDISKLNGTDNSACLQVRLHINTTTPASSGILNPVNGRDVGHPAQGKLTTATTPTLASFTTAVNTWAAVEAALN